MTMRTVKHSCCLMFFVGWLLTGCKYIECGEYNRYVDDKEANEQLLRWADANVFNREFTDADLRVGSIVGPGGRFKSISIERSDLHVPKWFEDHELKVLGPDQYKPNVIFVGKRRYQGLIIARRTLEDSIAGTEVILDLLEKRTERVAVICYQEKENMANKVKR